MVVPSLCKVALTEKFSGVKTILPCSSAEKVVLNALFAVIVAV